MQKEIDDLKLLIAELIAGVMNLKLKLLIDAVRITMKREKVTAEEARVKYTLSEEERATILGSISDIRRMPT